LITKKETLHAESNAILKAAKSGVSTDNSTLYITLSPCIDCAKLILQSGIKRVVYSEEYKDVSGIEFLRKFISIEKLEYEVQHSN
jgi:dCMP deaminase